MTDAPACTARRGGEATINKMSGPCSAKGTYELRIVTPGPLTAKHLRAIIGTLTITADFLSEDETAAIKAAPDKDAVTGDG